MKRFPHVLIVSALVFGSGLLFAADKKPAPATKEAKCCAAAAADGKDCVHSCCLEAAKSGKNCKKCGGAGMREAKKS